MNRIIHTFAEFLAANWPTPAGILLGLPAGVAWAGGCLAVAGWLKRRHGWRTGYTRKLFHFATFGSVAVLHEMGGTPAVCLFGAAVSLVVFCAVALGAGNLLYEAMAREKDAPHRTYFILTPFAATLIGGVASNILFGPAALAGYLVTGLGDAIGEPVGTRFGRHIYRVPCPWGLPAQRSLEGSAAVFGVSFFALSVLALTHGSDPTTIALVKAGAIAVTATAVEAVSPHGWDNATLQLVPTGLTAFCGCG